MPNAASGPRPPRIGIKDVAAAAGVSPTTVSHALSNKGRVDDATRDRILATCRELGYAPNRAAQSLKSGRSLTLGLSLPDIGGLSVKDLLLTEWYARFVVMAAAEATDHKYAVVVMPRIAAASDVARIAVDGVVVLDPLIDDRRLRILRAAGVPHVTVGREPVASSAPSVSVDVRGGATQLLQHLLQRGARSLLLLSGPTPDDYVTRFAAVFEELCVGGGARSRLEVVGNARTVKSSALYRQVGLTATAALDDAEPPDAIVGLFEGFGVAILEAARAASVAVPSHLRIAQDTNDSSSLTGPGITVLDQHLDQQAESSVQLLIDLLRGAEVASATVPMTLIVRAST
ncbi:LacI family DNA-binding transcriptional regulator [Jatrophihabitans sp.]|uniref:LacI family DNA-binding transcriptional regulator n=1 Tax=Jatrophihabitans sp. TaxID=1932789 RepID=UPI0030C75F05|nr:transcriptional regulator [Jatrophihabitans sp.]